MFRIPTKTKLKNIVPLSQYQMWLTCSAVISTLCQISKIQATLDRSIIFYSIIMAASPSSFPSSATEVMFMGEEESRETIIIPL